MALPIVDVSIASCGSNPFPGVIFKASDGKLYAGDALTPTFGPTGVVVTTGKWHQIDMRIDGSNNPWTIDVQVDGIACGQYTSARGPGDGLDLLYL